MLEASAPMAEVCGEMYVRGLVLPKLCTTAPNPLRDQQDWLHAFPDLVSFPCSRILCRGIKSTLKKQRGNICAHCKRTQVICLVFLYNRESDL